METTIANISILDVVRLVHRYFILIIVTVCVFVSSILFWFPHSMPTVFFIWGYMYPFTFIFEGTSKFLGVQSLTLHLLVQRKLTAFSPRKVVHHAVFCKYYAELVKTIFSVWHWVRQEVGFCLTHGLCVYPTIFFVILYMGSFRINCSYCYSCLIYSFLWFYWI